MHTFLNQKKLINNRPKLEGRFVGHAVEATTNDAKFRRKFWLFYRTTVDTFQFTMGWNTKMLFLKQLFSNSNSYNGNTPEECAHMLTCAWWTITNCRSSGHAVWGVGLERSYTGSRVWIPPRSWTFVLSFPNVCRKPLTNKNAEVNPKYQVAPWPRCWSDYK
jgi:hypothetical protein